MKHLKILVLTCLAAFALTSCFEDMDDNIIPGRDINDFVWKGMNAVYLYKSEIPNLDDGRFSSNEEYVNYLNDYSTPEELFESLKYSPSTVDRFSRIYSNYFDLQNQQAGTTLTDGLEYNLYLVPGSSTEVFGAITLVLENSAADNLGLQRGQIFRAVDGVELTVENRIDLLNQNSFTLNFADYDSNNTPEPTDDIITLNGESASLSKVAYTENPIHIAEVVHIDNLNVGYLMYNGFNRNFNNALNDTFAQFNAAGVSELVLDLRYNGGGSVQTATYLASMITGQFTGEVFSKLFYNANLSNNNNTFMFTNSIADGGTINSLNLNKVYVLTSNKRTASASELIINSLKPYIEVIVIGENTVGKTQASQTVYDSPTLFSLDGVNPSHSYAMQPLVANSTNVDDQLVPSTGLLPDVVISERPHTLGILGDLDEPLFAEALAHITASGRPAGSEFETYKFIDINMPIPALEQDMYVD